MRSSSSLSSSSLFLFLMVMKGSSIGALAFLPASMAADVIDVDMLESGEQRSGLFFSLWGMVNKGAVALGVLVATSAVAAFGFDPKLGLENSGAAKLAVACFYSVIPAALAIVADGGQLQLEAAPPRDLAEEEHEELERVLRDIMPTDLG